MDFISYECTSGSKDTGKLLKNYKLHLKGINLIGIYCFFLLGLLLRRPS